VLHGQSDSVYFVQSVLFAAVHNSSLLPNLRPFKTLSVFSDRRKVTQIGAFAAV